jgi:beta-glucosidase/6-phospho-beta-glucosidase/beta-galactosidase
MFSQKWLFKTPRGLRIRMRYASAEIIDRLADLYWNRYRRPLFISETASEGSVRRRATWLEDSIAAVRRVRDRGVPLVGYTWWPLFALVTWAYREGKKPPSAYLKQMGLWDLQPTPQGLERIRTRLVDRYTQLVAAGGRHVS